MEIWESREVAESGHCCVCSWLEHGRFLGSANQVENLE